MRFGQATLSAQLTNVTKLLMKERYDKSVNNQQLQRKREELTREIRNHDYDHNIMHNFKTALTSSLARFRRSKYHFWRVLFR